MNTQISASSKLWVWKAQQLLKDNQGCSNFLFAADVSNDIEANELQQKALDTITEWLNSDMCGSGQNLIYNYQNGEFRIAEFN